MKLLKKIFSITNDDTHKFVNLGGIKFKFRIPKPKAYYSQCGQDGFVLGFFKNKKDGFFIEIGAHNGIACSNTKKLEELGWKGICVEPNPNVFKDLVINRPNCDNYNVAIGNNSGKFNFTKITGYSEMLSGLTEEYEEAHLQRIEREVNEHGGTIEIIPIKVMTFDELMSNHAGIKTIDYISIDTEGNEFKILKSIDFKKHDIKVLSVENNYDDSEVREYMIQQGYNHTKCDYDDIYIKKD